MTNVQQKIQSMRGALNASFIDRAAAIDGVLCALVSRQHVLMIGPPGTGKSAIATAVTDGIVGGKCFNVLLTRTTTPDEVWGPVDLLAFDQGRFERKIDNYLPACHIAFLDEVWRGSSAILNTLLRAVNERKWEHNGKLEDLPLRSCIGASNSLPESDDLSALDDRFALRFFVNGLARFDDKKRLLKMTRNPSVPDKYRITLDELDEAYSEAKKVAFPEPVVDMLIQIWEDLNEKGYYISERRWRAIQCLMQARAWLDGRAEVTPEDCDVIADSVWRKPTDRSEILGIIYRVAAPAVTAAVEMYDLALSAVRMIPTREKNGSNDVAVAKAASDAKKRIKSLLVDLEQVLAKAEQHERSRINEYKTKIEQARDSMTRKLQEVILE